MINKDTITKIIDTAQIIEVIKDFLSLRKKGVNYIGYCPFHNEKTPSFIVSPAKNVYKCFGCGKSGNAITFVMEHEKLSYPKALKYLAKKYNIHIPEQERSLQEIQQQNIVESMILINHFAQKYFSTNLQQSNFSLYYLKERGFTADIINKFQIGYSLPTKNDFTLKAINNAFSIEYLHSTGLSISNNDQSYDRFNNRIMFPIHNVVGHIIGFGGRVLEKKENTAKYVNSPESEIYHKGDNLYGLYFSKRSIIQNDKVYLVEGYTDLISLFQKGIENVVASSGTSLTLNQIILIRRFTKNITIIYDGDIAGFKATIRSIDLILSEGLNVKIIILPANEDPDSFVKSKSLQEINDYFITNEKDFILFKLQLLNTPTAQNDIAKKAEIINDIINSISIIPDFILQNEYIKECSKLLSINEDTLKKELINLSKKTKQETIVVPEKHKLSIIENLEKEIIKILLNYSLNKINENETAGNYIINLLLLNEITFKNTNFNLILKEFIWLITNKHQYNYKYFYSHENQQISQVCIEILTEDDDISKVWDSDLSDTMLNDIINNVLKQYKKEIIINCIENVNNELKSINSIGVFDKLHKKLNNFYNLKNKIL